MSVVEETQSNQTNSKNERIDYSSKIAVYLRLRPMNKLETSKRSKKSVYLHSSSDDNNNIDRVTDLTIDSPLEGEFDFSFDKVRSVEDYSLLIQLLQENDKKRSLNFIILLQIFKEDTKQQEIYDSVSKHAEYLVCGFNTAVICFGQSGTGKSFSMLGENPLNKSVGQKKGAENTKQKDSISDKTGVIPRMAKDIFDHMGKASPVNEFTVRVSYVEIYLEQIRDLLNPSTKFLKINGGEEKSDYERRKGPILEGLTEVCCLEWTELVALLFRGNSFRVVSGERKQTDLNQSHSIFTIKIEQRNINTGRTITSKMHLVDLAGSEPDCNIPKVRSPRRKPKTNPKDRERQLVNRSHVALQNVMSALETYHNPSNHGGLPPPLPPHPDNIPYHESKLTRILWNALGGNSHTTFLLTASVASFNVKSTMGTLRFGQKCMQITNFPFVNIEASPEECNIELEKSKQIQSELLVLIKEIGSEMRRIKDKGVINPVEDEGPLWNRLNEICESNKYFVLDDQSTGVRTNKMSISLQDELKRKEEEVKDLQAKLIKARNARDNAQTQMLEMEGECVFLRNESEEVLAAKKRNTEEMIDAQNEIQRLSQRKLELEHDLRTCRFRENEAITFARLFRRFYRKLLQNNAALGTGSPHEVILKMAGVPNMDDLIDIDVLMYESGLIEEHEVNSNMNAKEYKPSTNAMIRSSALASKAKRQARSQFTRNNSTDMTSVSKNSISTKSGHWDNSSRNNVVVISSSSDSVSGELNPNSNRETISLQSPSDALADKRIDKLERDLLHITRRCIDLQLALNESEEWVELLTLSKNKKKILEENIKLKDQLKKKESDMQAIVWKMNEIQIINDTYNQRFSSREEHISYLEDKLAQLQDKEFIQTQKQQDTERKLQTEIMRLNSLLDAIARVHWQDGKKSQSTRLESRIVIPFQGGSSLEPSVRQNLLRPKEASISGSKTQFSETDSRDGRTTAGISYAPSYGPSVASSIYVDKNLLASHNIKMDDDWRTTAGLSYAPSVPSSSSTASNHNDRTNHNNLNPLFSGGKNINYEPRRLAAKKSVKIMAAVMRKPPSTSSTKTSKQTLLNQQKINGQTNNGDFNPMTPPKASPTKQANTFSPNTVIEIDKQKYLESNKKDMKIPRTPTSSSSNRSIQSVERQKSLNEAKKKLEELELHWK